MLRTILMCLVGLLVIGFLVWAATYLCSGFIEPTILELFRKVAIVLAGACTVWRLSSAGRIPRVGRRALPWRDRPSWQTSFADTCTSSASCASFGSGGRSLACSWFVLSLHHNRPMNRPITTGTQEPQGRSSSRRISASQP